MNDVTEEMMADAGLDAEERKLALACEFKHTKYQPTEKEFCCPKCGAECGVFCVDDGPNMDCPLVHDEDTLNCYGKERDCGYGVGAAAFVRNLLKKKNLVPCKHCKGKGYVSGKKS